MYFLFFFILSANIKICKKVRLEEETKANINLKEPWDCWTFGPQPQKGKLKAKYLRGEEQQFLNTPFPPKI